VFFLIYFQYFPYCLFVSNSQVIGYEDRLRNDLYCVGWGVKLYSTNIHLLVSMWISEIAAIATGGSKRRITVSTVREAEVFANDGYDDIIFAAHFGPDKIPRYVNAMNINIYIVLFLL